MRPRKLRLLVATTRSPSLKMPPVRPQQSPQPGCVTIAPASTSVLIAPQAAASTPEDTDNAPETTRQQAADATEKHQ